MVYVRENLMKMDDDWILIYSLIDLDDLRYP